MSVGVVAFKAVFGENRGHDGFEMSCSTLLFPQGDALGRALPCRARNEVDVNFCRRQSLIIDGDEVQCAQPRTSAGQLISQSVTMRGVPFGNVSRDTLPGDRPSIDIDAGAAFIGTSGHDVH